MSDYSRLSVEGMADLISAMKRGNGALSTGMETIRSRMRSNDVSLLVFNDIDRIAEWTEDQVPGLERRRNMAEALSANQPAGTVVRVDEPIPFDSPEEAEAYGRELAQVLLEDGTIDAGTFDEMFEAMEGYVNDPDVMAGFYLELGPDYAGRLPTLLDSTGSENAERYLELFNIGLGTALNTTDNTSSSSDYYSEFSDFREQWRDSHDDPALSWDRLAMLQHGDFPPRWLSDVVRNAVLEDFEGEGWGEIDFRSGFTPRLGLSEDTLALAFSALANNPSAVRIALDEKGGISIEEYVERVYGIQGTRSTGDAITEAFGQAIASGSGALDDPPDKGSHASSFAFQAILALGRHEETPWGMREPMGQIAAAYAEELLVGSFTLDARARESSMDRPEPFGIPPGMDPTFYLSPEAVYRFLHGFGHHDQLSVPFDEAVKELYETLPAQALEADLAATGAGERDPMNFEAAMSMFGTLAGLQYQAQKSVRGEMDRRDEELRGTIQQTISELLTLSPTPPFFSNYAWKFTKIFIGRNTKSWAGNAGGRVDELEMEQYQARLLYDYGLADLMLKSGYPHTEPIPPNLLNESGDGLRHPAEIVEDPELWTEFYNWTDSNNMDFADHPHRPPFDDKFDNSGQYFDAGDGNRSEVIAGEADWESSVR